MDCRRELSYPLASVLGVEEALATLDEAMDRCLSVLLAARSSEQLVGYLDRLQAHQQRLAAVQAAVVRELEVFDVPRRHGATSMMAWLRARYRISPGAAKRLACLAGSTGDRTPMVTARLAAGTLNADQASVIAKVVANVPGEARAKAEEHLVTEAKTFGPDDLGRLGERILEHVAPELVEQQAESALERAEQLAYDKRELNITDIAGTSKVRIHGLMDREAAAHLRAAIDPLSAPRPTKDAPDPRTPGQRRADALVDVCKLVNQCGELPENGGDRPQVVVTIDYHQLRNAVRAKQGAGALDNGTQLSPQTVRQWACDAEILPVVLAGASRACAERAGPRRRTGTTLHQRSDPPSPGRAGQGLRLPRLRTPTALVPRSPRRTLDRPRQNKPGKQRPALRPAPPAHPPRRMASPHQERPPRLRTTTRRRLIDKVLLPPRLRASSLTVRGCLPRRRSGPAR